MKGLTLDLLGGGGGVGSDILEGRPQSEGSGMKEDKGAQAPEAVLINSQ